MRNLALGLLLFVFSNGQAQTYSSIIKDSEISDFMNGLIRISYNGHAISVNNEIISTPDTSDLHDAVLKEFFDKDDTSFFIQQIKAIKKNSWGRPLGHNKLIMKISVRSNPPINIYSFSIPLFSRNRKTALVIEGFYCGMLCGGGAFYICKLQADGTWGKVKKFKEWAE